MERLTRTHRTKGRGKEAVYKETYYQEGLLDIYVKMVQKLGLHPIIATVDFVLLILLLWFGIVLSGSKDAVIGGVFALVLIVFVWINMYAYKRQYMGVK